MTNTWKHPVLGIMTATTESQYEHVFGVLFDAADPDPLTHVRLINYSGLSIPPSAAPTNNDIPVDGGMLIAITPQTAQHMVDEVNALEKELQESPHPRRYYFAEHIVPLPTRALDKEGRLAARAEKVGAVLAGSHSRPTNCVHFVMQEAHRAGVDLAAIDPALIGADDVYKVTRLLDAATKEPSPDGSAFHHGALANGHPVVYFRSAENQSLVPLLQTLPQAARDAWCNAAPLVRPHAARVEESRQQDAVIHR